MSLRFKPKNFAFRVSNFGLMIQDFVLAAVGRPCGGLHRGIRDS